MTGCENYCNGYYVWNGNNWVAYSIINDTPGDPAGCTPVPEPRVYYSGADQGGIVIYNNGTITIHSTGNQVCPSGAYCFYPGDKDMRPKTYCSQGPERPDPANDPCQGENPAPFCR